MKITFCILIAFFSSVLNAQYELACRSFNKTENFLIHSAADLIQLRLQLDSDKNDCKTLDPAHYYNLKARVYFEIQNKILEEQIEKLSDAYAETKAKYLLSTLDDLQEQIDLNTALSDQDRRHFDQHIQKLKTGLSKLNEVKKSDSYPTHYLLPIGVGVLSAFVLHFACQIAGVHRSVDYRLSRGIKSVTALQMAAGNLWMRYVDYFKLIPGRHWHFTALPNRILWKLFVLVHWPLGSDLPWNLPEYGSSFQEYAALLNKKSA
jgi:hypothetical protein